MLTSADPSFCLDKDKGNLITRRLCGHSKLKGKMAAGALICEAK